MNLGLWLCHMMMILLQKCQSHHQQYQQYQQYQSPYLHNQYQNTVYPPAQIDNTVDIYGPMTDFRGNSVDDSCNNNSCNDDDDDYETDTSVECFCNCNECANPADCCLEYCLSCPPLTGFAPNPNTPEPDLVVIPYAVPILIFPIKNPKDIEGLAENNTKSKMIEINSTKLVLKTSKENMIMKSSEDPAEIKTEGRESVEENKQHLKPVSVESSNEITNTDAAIEESPTSNETTIQIPTSTDVEPSKEEKKTLRKDEKEKSKNKPEISEKEETNETIPEESQMSGENKITEDDYNTEVEKELSGEDDGLSEADDLSYEELEESSKNNETMNSVGTKYYLVAEHPSESYTNKSRPHSPLQHKNNMTKVTVVKDRNTSNLIRQLMTLRKIINYVKEVNKRKAKSMKSDKSKEWNNAPLFGIRINNFKA